MQEQLDSMFYVLGVITANPACATNMKQERETMANIQQLEPLVGDWKVQAKNSRLQSRLEAQKAEILENCAEQAQVVLDREMEIVHRDQLALKRLRKAVSFVAAMGRRPEEGPFIEGWNKAIAEVIRHLNEVI